MLELGPAGEQLHRQAGRYIAEKKIDLLLGVRGPAQAMVEGARQAGMRVEFVATPEEAGEWLMREARNGDVVLLKASRGVKLEKALEVWKALRGDTVREIRRAREPLKQAVGFLCDSVVKRLSLSLRRSLARHGG